MPKRADSENKAAASGQAPTNDFSPIRQIILYDLNDPLTWRARIGKACVAIAKAVFDVAEKILVVVAFSVSAQLTTNTSVDALSVFLGLLLALYVSFQLEKLLAQVFAYMRWHGAAALVAFSLLMFVLFVVTSAVLVPWVEQVTDAVVQATN